MDAKTDTYVDCAIRWAMEALDSTEYQTLCLKFVEDAYEISNHIELDGHSAAKESADAYDAQENTGVPPKGAWAPVSVVLEGMVARSPTRSGAER